MTSPEQISQEFPEKNKLSEQNDSHDSSKKELTIFGKELDHLKGDILEYINRKQDTKDKQEANLLLDILQDGKQQTDNKKNAMSSQNTTSLDIQNAIVQKIGNENPLANQGRAKAYTSVSDFTAHVRGQGGVFGKLVDWLS